MLDTILQVLALLLAAVIATLLRFWDFPTENLRTVDLQAAVMTFIGAAIAAFFAVWAGGLDPTVWQEFVLVTIAAIGGMAGVRAIFEVTKREVNEPAD